MSMSIRIFLQAAIVSLFVILSDCGFANNYNDYVRDAFSRADFFPHAYSDADIVAEYGGGNFSQKAGAIYRTYYSERFNLWVRFTGDAGVASKYRVIEEIIVSSIELSKAKHPFHGSLFDLKLLGVKIGDSEIKVSHVMREGDSKRGETFLNGRRVLVYTRYREGSDIGLSYNFFIKNHKVVGLSIGITE